MLEKILQIASHITHPVTAAAFATAFIGWALWVVVKDKDNPIKWLLASGLILIGVIGFVPVVASTVLAYRGVYRIRVTVLSPDHQPAADADVKATAGEKNKTNSGWEFVIYPQTKPADSKVTIYASVSDSYLAGESTVALDKDYYPSTEIHLQKLPSVTIHGEVIDENQKGIAGASVLLPECSQSTKTDQNGLFSLPSCIAQGQRTSLRAEKGNLAASIQVIAGQTAQIVLRKN